LAAHIDVFPTLAELAGAPLTADLRQQVEGRSLVTILQDSDAAWPDRRLVTHVGRWERGQVAGAKYRNCSIRNTRWQMVCVARAGQKDWQLFDLKTDSGQKNNVAAQHPEVVKELDAAYDQWWESIQPQLVNENAVGPEVNPFKALYWEQFGGRPTNSPQAK
jgi:arylsulfatase